jgi:tetratricopeptide (TPR) repeat protein
MHHTPPRRRRPLVHRPLILAAFLAAAAVAAPQPAPAPVPEPTPDQIRQAVDDLASPRFAVRERASKLLWEAGKSAEEALRAAAKSKDEETANRAKAIVEKFDWGLYPDTPAGVVKLIEKFRGGDADTRQQAVAELIQLKPARFDVLRKVIAQEQDDNTRRQMYERMSVQAREAVPQLIVDGHVGEAAELLEICVSPNNPASLGDYATFNHLRGRLPEAIARMEALRKREADAPRATEALVYLYRIKRDWAAARKAADAAKNSDLLDALAWEAADWKWLAENSADAEVTGAKAAYYRLAGDKAKYDEIIGELRKDLMGVEGDDAAAYVLAHALLLNGQGAEAITVLKDRRKRGTDLVFDLLCAQLKFKEAFAYADAADKELKGDPDSALERDQLALRKAAVLAGLGDRESATQIFRGLFDRGLGPNPDRLNLDRPLIDVVRVVARTGMRDLAAECAARCLEQFRKADLDFEAPEALAPVFEERTHVVLTWWQAVMTDDPKPDAIAAMRRVLEFVDGKVDRKKADRLAELIQKARAVKSTDLLDKKLPLVTPIAALLSGPRGDFAIAEAYQAAGAMDKAEEFYKKAAEGKAGPADDPRTPLEDLPDEADQGIVPKNYRYLLGYADFLFGRKRFKEAAAQFRKTWEAAPSQPLPLLMTGQALKLAGDEKEGARLMALAHWVPLGNEVMRAKFSEDLFKRGLDADSRQEMELIVTTGWFRSYSVGNVHLRMARMKARQGDFATAAKMYEKDVVSLFRTTAQFVDGKAYLTVPELARTYRARALVAAGKLDEALAEARASLAVLPGNIELGLGLIPDLDKGGKKKEADELYAKIKAAYEGALADHGSSGELRNSLAWTQVNCNRDLDEALKHAQKAVEVSPRTTAYIDTLAEVYFRKKDRAKALELMKQCAALDPTNPYFRKQLERFEKKPFDSPLPDEETGDD